MENNLDTININGKNYNIHTIENFSFDNGKSEDWIKSISTFLKNWFDEKSYIVSYTSGSTGTPKEIKIEKSRMVESAKLTISFFELSKEQTTLLCLPCESIGGKMILVRAMLAGMNIIAIKPSVNPFESLNENCNIDFAAMTPMQITTGLKIDQKQKINKIKKLIIGGSPLSKETEIALQNLNTEVYETFGMTETISHIALRKLNGKNKSIYFKALKGIQLGLDDRNCLTIHAPKILESPIVTNDLVEFLDINGFKWLGRVDNIINSGGVKIVPEILEDKIYTLYNLPFFVAGIRDDLTGEKVIMIIEGEDLDRTTKSLLMNSLKEILPKNQSPKEIINSKVFIRTISGKIKRKETLKQLFLKQ